MGLIYLCCCTFEKNLILEGRNLKSKTYSALKFGWMSVIMQAQCHDLCKATSFVRRSHLITFEIPILTALVPRSICLSAVNYQEPTSCTAVGTGSIISCSFDIITGCVS